MEVYLHYFPTTFPSNSIVYLYKETCELAQKEMNLHSHIEDQNLFAKAVNSMLFCQQLIFTIKREGFIDVRLRCRFCCTYVLREYLVLLSEVHYENLMDKLRKTKEPKKPQKKPKSKQIK